MRATRKRRFSTVLFWTALTLLPAQAIAVEYSGANFSAQGSMQFGPCGYQVTWAPDNTTAKPLRIDLPTEQGAGRMLLSVVRTLVLVSGPPPTPEFQCPQGGTGAQPFGFNEVLFIGAEQLGASIGSYPDAFGVNASYTLTLDAVLSTDAKQLNGSFTVVIGQSTTNVCCNPRLLPVSGSLSGTFMATRKAKIVTKVSDNNGEADVFDVKPSQITGVNDEPFVSVTIECLNEDGEQVEDCSIELSVDEVVDPGGHNHDDERPLGGFVRDDRCSAKEEPFEATESSGRFVVKYCSPPAGGTLKIAGSAEADGFDDDEFEFNIQVRVKDLNELSAHPSIYELTGGSDTHQSNSNHFGLATFNAQLAIAAAAFQPFVLLKGLRPLAINDMSLPFGGVFDICADGTPSYCTSGATPWTKPHSSHRFGIDADLGSPQFVERLPRGVARRYLRGVLNVLGLPPISEPARGGTCDPQGDPNSAPCTHWHVRQAAPRLP